jgi:uroporphyrinogen III methyltransferase/synthase
MPESIPDQISKESIFGATAPDKTDLLSGVSVLVTRGVHQSSPLSQQLLELGASVFEFPVIALVRPDSFAELEEALQRIQTYDWIIFASVNAVDFFFEHYRQCQKDTAALEAELSNVRFATVGPATADALERQGYQSSFTPQSFVADALVDEFELTFVLAGSKFLWPRTTAGRQTIKERFTKAGALVDVVAVYQTVMPEDALSRSKDLLELMETKSVDFVALASSQSVKNFDTIIRHALEQRHIKEKRQETLDQMKMLSQALTGVEFISIGPETSRTIGQVLGRSPLQARTFTIPGMVERLIESVTAIG